MTDLDDRNTNSGMIQEEHEEAFIEYHKEPYSSKFMKMERDTRPERKGIWSLTTYERPGDFRKRLKVCGEE